MTIENTYSSKHQRTNLGVRCREDTSTAITSGEEGSPGDCMGFLSTRCILTTLALETLTGVALHSLRGERMSKPATTVEHLPAPTLGVAPHDGVHLWSELPVVRCAPIQQQGAHL